MERHLVINKYISIIKRWSNPYFDKHLVGYGIGSGQQFFLIHISKNPGISLQELAFKGGYDKATSTRAVKRLMEEGYVIQKTDMEDKRLRHLYLTKKAQPVLEKTWEIMGEWNSLITQGFTQEEINQIEDMLERMAGNAYAEATRKCRHKGE